MWAVDKASGSQFSDARADHGNLFEAMGYECLWDDLKKRYSGQIVAMAKLEAFAIEKTDYLPTHVRKILTQREMNGEIVVQSLPGCRHRGKTYPSDKVQIAFPS